MPQINPAMQPHIRREFRRWQQTPHGAYGYGECPLCGNAGSCEFEGYSDTADTELESWACDQCGCEWETEKDYVYRFVRIVPEDER